MKIKISGNPIAKKRPRFATRKYGVAVINDQQTEEGRFLFDVINILGDKKPIETHLKITLGFFMKRPKSHYGTGKNLGKVKKSALIYHAVKPDLDNLIKFTLDCLNGVLFKDDSQIYSIESFKEYSDNPRTEIEWL